MLRQQVIATATVYFKRFYARNSLKNIDPLLLAPTCLLLAIKVEEFDHITHSRVINSCAALCNDLISFLFLMRHPERPVFFLIQIIT